MPDSGAARSPRGGAGAMPDRIGRFRIVDRIGRGSMGVVYSAEDEGMGRPVALKVLMADLESDPETRARFYREAQAAASLLHPNIITIFDAGEDQGRSFIAMQLLEGLPLAEYLKRPEGVSADAKLDLMIQIGEGLAAAHNQGIVHRDLKPSNLFVQSDGLLKILDFGVARLADSNMTRTGTMLGTPDYMSPEQARGETVDARSDIFSAGAVFYFILSGKKPFPGPDLPAVLKQLQFDDPAPLIDPDSQVLEPLVRRAMAKDVHTRPSRIEEILSELVRVRRQYQAAARKLVSAVRSRLDEVRSLLKSLADTAATLGLPDDLAQRTFLDDLHRRFPALEGRGTTIEMVGSDRAGIAALVDELTVHRDQLAQSVETRRSSLVTIEEGQAALAAGDARRAVQLFESVVATFPDSPALQALRASAGPLALEQEARERRVHVRTEAARHAIDTQNWAVAVAECREALAIVPGHELARAQMAEAEEGMDRERRRVAQLTDRLLDRALAAISKRDFADAEAAVDEAARLLPTSRRLPDVRTRMVSERAAAEAADALHRLSLDEIRRARSAFRRGRYDEAIQQLRGLLEVEPDAHEARRELERLIAFRETLATRGATARRAADGLLQQAGPLSRAGSFAEAIGFLREGLRIDPTHVEAATTLNDLLQLQLEERLTRERTLSQSLRADVIGPLLVLARSAHEQGYVDIALNAALAAQQVSPGEPEALSIINGAREELGSEDQEVFELRPFSLESGGGPVTGALAPAPTVSPGAQEPKTLRASTTSSGGVLDWATRLLQGRAPRGNN